MGLSRYEQETSIIMNAEQDTVEIFTADPVYLRKLEKLRSEYPDAYVLKYKNAETDGSVSSAAYTMPKKYIRFGRPASEARREAGKKAAERMLAARNGDSENG